MTQGRKDWHQSRALVTSSTLISVPRLCQLGSNCKGLHQPHPVTANVVEIKVSADIKFRLNDGTVYSFIFSRTNTPSLKTTKASL